MQAWDLELIWLGIVEVLGEVLRHPRQHSPLSGREYDGLGSPRLGPSHFEHAETRECREPELFF